MTATKLALLGAVAAAALGTPRLADALPKCSLAKYGGDVVEYWHSAPDTDPMNFRCDWDTGKCSLSGWMLWSSKATPSGNPAVIFEHGSQGQEDSDQQSIDEYSCAIQTFLDAGYVVYMPYRRGTFDITTAAIKPASPLVHDWPVVHGIKSNSGWGASDFASVDPNGVGNRTLAYIEYLQDEADDLVPVINTLDAYKRPGASAPLVDARRVAIVGHSMGGAFVTIASTDDDLYTQTKLKAGPRAFVSLSGAAMSWYGSHWWNDIMQSSAAIHNAPIMFTRVKNESDPDIGPVDFQSATVPFQAAQGTAGGARILRAPAIAPGNCPADLPEYWCVHGTFVTEKAHISTWFDGAGGVNQFLHDSGL